MDIGWLAGITGIDPIDVPAGNDVKVESAGEGLAGIKLRGREEKPDGELLGRSGVLCAGRSGREQHAAGEEQGEQSGSRARCPDLAAGKHTFDFRTLARGFRYRGSPSKR